jgi:hypothetical protein
LAEFTIKQAKEDRCVIDAWFKRASWGVGIVILVASGALAFVGWKTIDSAKESAKDSAVLAAQLKIREILQDARVQEMAKIEATKLFDNGAYARIVKDEVARQLPVVVGRELAMRAPQLVAADVAKQLPGLVMSEVSKHDTFRQVSKEQSEAFLPRLRKFRGSHVSVYIRGLSDDIGFASSVIKVLEAAGIDADYALGVMYNGNDIKIGPVSRSPNRELANTLAAFMNAVTGATFVLQSPAADETSQDAAVFIPHALSAPPR